MTSEEDFYDAEVTDENRDDVERALLALLANEGRTEAGCLLRELILTGTAGDKEAGLVARILEATLPQTSDGSRSGLNALEIGSDVTAQGVQALAASLQSAFALQELLLPLNRLGAAGLHVLLHGIRHAEQTWHGCRLHTIVLARCQLGDDGAALLGGCFPSHVRLLHLEDNDISDTGAVSLAGALRQRRGAAHLVHVCLDRNNIGRAGADALLALQNDAPSLYRFSLAGNPAAALFHDCALAPDVAPPLAEPVDGAHDDPTTTVEQTDVIQHNTSNHDQHNTSNHDQHNTSNHDQHNTSNHDQHNTINHDHNTDDERQNVDRQCTPSKQTGQPPRSVLRSHQKTGTPTRSRSAAGVARQVQPKSLQFEPAAVAHPRSGFHLPSFLLGVVLTSSLAGAAWLKRHQLEALLRSLSERAFE